MKNTLTIFTLFLLFATATAQAQTYPDSIYIYNSVEMGTCENSQSVVWQSGNDPDHITLFGDIYGSFTGNEVYKVIICDSTGSFANADTVDGSNMVIDSVNHTFNMVFHLTQPVCINCYFIKIYVPSMNYTSETSVLGWSVFPMPGIPLVQWPSLSDMAHSTCTQDSVTFCVQVTDTLYPSGVVAWEDFFFSLYGMGTCYTTYDGIPCVRYIESVTDVACYSEVILDYAPGYFETPTITLSNDTLVCDLVNYAYQWYLEGTPIAGASQQYYVPSATGNYSVETTLGTCINTSNIINVTSVGLNAIANGKVSISPNPFNEQLTVQINAAAVQCFIINNLGQVVLQQQLTSTQNKIDTQSLSPGLYHISLKGNGISTNERLVKQ